MIKMSTVITALVIIVLLVVGFIMFGYLADVSPDITPDYGRDFAAGTTPYTYDTDHTDLANIVVTMYNYSSSAWDRIPSANVSYSDETVTVDTAAVNTTNHNTTTHIKADYKVDLRSTWATVAGVIIAVVTLSIILVLLKVLPKKK